MSKRFEELKEVIRRLRRECPWDSKQTHSSLRSNMLQECYEALEAIDDGNMEKLKEELGDMLLHIMLHSEIASEAGKFDIEDVVESIKEKLIRRHPHIFGGERVRDAEEVLMRWHRLKEKEGYSLLNGIPKDLPALAYSREIQERASRVGFDWERVEGIIEKLCEEIEELRRAKTPKEKEREFGDIFFTLVNIARREGIDPESALREANRRFYRRFSYMEELCRKRGLDLSSLPLEEMDKLWEEAKRAIP